MTVRMSIAAREKNEAEYDGLHCESDCGECAASGFCLYDKTPGRKGKTDAQHKSCGHGGSGTAFECRCYDGADAEGGRGSGDIAD